MAADYAQVRRAVMLALIDEPGGIPFRTLRKLVDRETHMKSMPLLRYLLEMIEQGAIEEIFVDEQLVAQHPRLHGHLQEHLYRLTLEEWVVQARRVECRT